MSIMASRYNLPLVTRCVLATLLFLYFLSAAYQYRTFGHSISPLYGYPSLAPQVVVVPTFVTSYPWTLFTATYVEANIFTLIVSGLTLFFGGRYLERAWSSSQLATLLLVIALVPNIACLSLYGAFAATGLFNAKNGLPCIYGGPAYQIAFLIALKQLVPEHTVSVAKSSVRIRVKHFPALFLLVQTLFSLVFGNGSAMFLTWSGFMTSWIYLRFYRRTRLLSTTITGEGSIIRGDASETFAFAHFFPDPLYMPVSVVSNFLYDCLISLRICSPFTAEDVDASNEQAIARRDFELPATTRQGQYEGTNRREEAERRRALALKALDQRLHSSPAKPTPDEHSLTEPHSE